MHITKEETYECLGRFLPEIRSGAGIPLETMIVNEPWRLGEDDDHDKIMFSEHGIIHIYPEKDYSPLYVNTEKSVLHELGHRAIEAINPKFYAGLHTQAGYDLDNDGLIKTIAQITINTLNGKVFVPHALQEGLAEYFSLEIFPKLCSLSDFGRSFIEDARINAQKGIFIRPNKYFSSEEKLIAKSYKFFNRMYTVDGLDGKYGIKEYIKNAPNYKLPRGDDWDAPLLYLKEQGSKTCKTI